MQLKALRLGAMSLAGAVLLAAALPAPHAAAQAADDPAISSEREAEQLRIQRAILDLVPRTGEARERQVRSLRSRREFSAARDTLETYLKRRAVVGEAWLFPRDERRLDEPMTRRLAEVRLNKAEGLADLLHQKRGGWHAFRRAWATRRKHLPVQDVMAAGGWRDINALQKAYQAADPETVRRVMELSAGG